MMQRWLKRRSERGAVAVVVAISLVALMGAAAIGVDIGRLVFERQQLQNSLDAAAAAGVMKLPEYPEDAIAEAEKFAKDNMIAANLGPITPKIALRCVTVFNKVTKAPDWPTVEQVCGITSHAWNDPLDCNEESGICSVPCTKADRCNTIVVKYTKTVEYTFGPAIGIPTGNTGTIVSAACRNYCGTPAPNPMNIVLMADRTPSMGGAIADLRVGIAKMLGYMSQEQQYVAFGALAISKKTTGVSNGKTLMKAVEDSAAGFSDADEAEYSGNDKKTTWSSQNKKWHFNGTWVPIKFSEAYQNVDTSGVGSMDSSSVLGSAVDGLQRSNSAGNVPWPWHMATKNEVLVQSNFNTKKYDRFGQSDAGYGNTHLASALKAAVRYALYTDPEKDLGLKDRSRFGPARKVVIFETDGSPVEVFNSDSSALDLTNDLDIGATNDGTNGGRPQDVLQKACDNFLEVAKAAKAGTGAKKVTLIMIGVGGANKSACGNKTVPQTLAEAASPKEDGTPSFGADCDLPGVADKVNGDLDNYFCASSAKQLQNVFLHAAGSLNEKSTLMKLPNAENLE